MITIRNKANKKDAERLMGSVTAIAAMTPEAVTAAFKNQLINEGYGEKGGAGLGMLQIARKVGRNIKANIQPLSLDEFICTSVVSTQLSKP